MFDSSTVQLWKRIFIVACTSTRKAVVYHPISITIAVPSKFPRAPSKLTPNSLQPSVSMPTEQTPLLWNRNLAQSSSVGKDVHTQFCTLTGCPPSHAPLEYNHHTSKNSLYGRACTARSSQNVTYLFTATLTNTLLLSQVVLGAALTGLGASKQPYIIVTLFGALNTVIAGLVAYLKSRGQPMRSRMYRDDLERVVDEIENSEVMWLGISNDVQGYDDLADSEVTVRSEVARLTRLYERAVRNNTMNNPDMYSSGSSMDGSGGGGGGGNTRQPNRQTQQNNLSVPAVAPVPVEDAAPAAAVDPTPAVIAPTPAPLPPPPAPVATDPDISPASAPPRKEKNGEPPKQEAKKDDQSPKQESKQDEVADDQKSKLQPGEEGATGSAGGETNDAGTQAEAKTRGEDDEGKGRKGEEASNPSSAPPPPTSEPPPQPPPSASASTAQASAPITAQPNNQAKEEDVDASPATAVAPKPKPRKLGRRVSKSSEAGVGKKVENQNDQSTTIT